MSPDSLIETVKTGFSSLKVGETYKTAALAHIKSWLSEAQYAEYLPQLEHLIEAGHWDYLLDSFYQVIPFGTGGRRGEVGIGPNRINQITIQSSAQGHSQFLLKVYGEEAKSRGVVLAYDIRQFFTNKFFNDNLPNPVRNLKGVDLALAAAQVYAANGIKTYLFDDFRTTPELAFAIRHLKAVAGDVFSASHNPPEHNGKKVYDEFGGQLVPPDDEALVEEVTQRVTEIKTIPVEEAKKTGLLEIIGEAVDLAYIEAGASLSLSDARDIKIVYTPLHGCGVTSVQRVLERLGFQLQVDPSTQNPSGKFEHVTFNIPNPEVIQSFDTPLAFAKTIDADIILNSDPDADRIGVMIKHQGEWQFINGNEIAAILTEYVIAKRKPALKGKRGVIIKTDVTTNLMTAICAKHDVEMIGNHLVGFKYIGQNMNELEKAGRMNEFLMACEESHGYIAGNYTREKDAVVPAIWLSELAAELKAKGETLIDYLNRIYATYGYFRNYLTEIRMPGAEGMSQIAQIQQAMRDNPPSAFGEYQLDRLEDWLDRQPIVSETDKVAKNGLVFHLKPVGGTASMRITLRPSGTEPKIKMYYEIGSTPFAADQLATVRADIEKLLKAVEKAFMLSCYKILGVDFPERGFLLFWQLPLKDKLHYFEVEPDLVALKEQGTLAERLNKVEELLGFLGSNPVEKVDDAFKAEYGQGVRKYLGLT